MARKARGLTARFVATATKPGLYGDGGGLYLQVAPAGARTWIYRYQLCARRRDMGLGSAAVFSLAEARVKAADARRLVAEGIDPIDRRAAQAAEDRLEAAKAVTFGATAGAYIKAMRPRWTNPKHAGQWETTLATYAYPALGELPVAGIDTGLVLQCLEPIWTTKPETASRVRGRIEAVLDYAKVRGWRDGENPARWKGHLAQILPAKTAVAKVRHHASLPYADMPAFWTRLREQDGIGARALELAILTATRSGEVLGARWQEIDLEAATWTIPAERMKADQEHRVPLAEPAVVLLRRMAETRVGAFVFSARRDRPLSNMSMAMVLRRMKVQVTTHGFRSTFRTWAAEATAFPHEVCEAALAHTQGDKVVAAYQRGDHFAKRRELMDTWARFVETGGADVVPMRRIARS